MSRSEPSPFHPDLRRPAAVLSVRGVGPRMLELRRRLDDALQVALRRERRPGPVEAESLGAVSVRVHRPPEGTPTPFRALLWMHGGGYVVGSAADDDELCRIVAADLGVLVAAVEYRLAPAHPFPVPLEDCYDALVWLASHRDVDEHRIAVGGASAGGGLATALALLARDRGDVTPVFQLLSYPMIDDRTVLRNDLDERHFRLWNSENNRFGWQSYLGMAPGTAAVPPLAAPARCADLAALPPAWIGVGTIDLFYDEDLAYANQLREAGVPCTVETVDGAFHGFDGACPRAPVTRRFRASQIRALAGALGGAAGLS
ncbi:MAG: alpha/beta hydrolase [Acidimicrobiia bacterium]